MSGRAELVPVQTVILVEEPEDIPRAIDESRSRREDAYWAARISLLFTWSRFLEWWIARRWVVPRKER